MLYHHQAHPYQVDIAHHVHIVIVASLVFTENLHLTVTHTPSVAQEKKNVTGPRQRSEDIIRTLEKEGVDIIRRVLIPNVVIRHAVLDQEGGTVLHTPQSHLPTGEDDVIRHVVLIQGKEDTALHLQDLRQTTGAVTIHTDDRVVVIPVVAVEISQSVVTGSPGERIEACLDQLQTL